MSTRFTVTATTATQSRINVTVNKNASRNDCIRRAHQYLTGLGFHAHEQIVSMDTNATYRVVGQAAGMARTVVTVGIATTHYV